MHGFNEFSVPPKPSMLLKFIETIYESPLNLLLLGSAAISAIMGNIDDAVSITIAILIVLTGELCPDLCWMNNFGTLLNFSTPPYS